MEHVKCSLYYSQLMCILITLKCLAMSPTVMALGLELGFGLGCSKVVNRWRKD